MTDTFEIEVIRDNTTIYKIRAVSVANLTTSERYAMCCIARLLAQKGEENETK